MINLNKVAVDITLKEGKKVSVSIAQVKEVIRLYNHFLAKEDVLDVLVMLAKEKKK